MKSNSEGLIIDGVVSYIDRDNIDTDQIIPTEYLKSIKKFGYEDYLFDGWRYKDDGKLGIKKEDRNINDDFILNNKPYTESKILLGRDNFGCGSSREHAVWALRDFGIKAVIASSFGDIFYNNCFKNGILPIKIDEKIVVELAEYCKRKEEIEISLEKQEIKYGNKVAKFELDPFKKKCLMEGLDDIALSMEKISKIDDYEKKLQNTKPWVLNNA